MMELITQEKIKMIIDEINELTQEIVELLDEEL